MASAADHAQIAAQARRHYIDQVLKGLPALVQAVRGGAQDLLDKPCTHQEAQRRRDLVLGLGRHHVAWHGALAAGLRHVAQHGVTATLPADMPAANPGGGLSLVDNDTIEREILTSRLALAVMDRASWEFTDLRSRIALLERRGELDTHDMLRAHVLARVALDGWRQSGLSPDDWREAQAVLHEEFATLAQEAYHETNRFLLAQRVMQDVDLRPLIRRTRDAAPTRAQTFGGDTQTGGMPTRGAASAFAPAAPAPTAWPSGGPVPSHQPPAAPTRPAASGGARPSTRTDGRIHEETRLMTRGSPLPRGNDHAEAVLGRLNRLMARHLPGFGETGTAASGASSRPVTAALSAAISNAQQSLRRRFAPGDATLGSASTAAPSAGGHAPTATLLQPYQGARGDVGAAGAGTPNGAQLVEQLQRDKQQLKKAASTPAERATIEIVAMMFQSILTEDRIPASVRVWFARLQMPVLRVAISEPDFFATLDHPARRLIDRMGACVMGLDGTSTTVGDALEKEVKRVVQVVEAYPDTGRRVFQTVLVEFEKFLDHYFKNENETTRRGVSLAQKVEQRETMAIQYTIELRRMLNEVPVQEGVRQFLFQIWADVLATSAVRYGPSSAETKAMKRAAADLIWSAGAKVTREERAEVIRRLPPLLKRLRDGMAASNMSGDKQEEQITLLNSALAAAFTAKAAAIPDDRLHELVQRLDSLEELLPEVEDLEIDESIVLDLSGHDSGELEVIGEGGSMPTPPMVAWARELLVGSWYRMEHGGQRLNVQLVWQGMRRQLSLFVAPSGRCLLFQQGRLAAWLQAGLLVPAQDEALTVRATRDALAKLDADPTQLMQ